MENINEQCEQNEKLSVGLKVKQLRMQQNMTLKELSQKTTLSASYLSLLERGQTSVTLVSMQNIAKALEVHPSIFLDEPNPSSSHVIREHEQQVFRLKNEADSIFYSLAVSLPDQNLLMSPMIKVLLPESPGKSPSTYTHENEEMGYVLEGVLNLYYLDRECQLYPGDFFHFSSTQPHCLINYSSKLTKIFYVTIPLINTENMDLNLIRNQAAIHGE